MAEWAGIAITAVLTIVGLYFANSLRLRTRADVERGRRRETVHRLRRAVGAHQSRLADARVTTDRG